MVPVLYRQADESDFPAVAGLRAATWGTEEYWRVRIPRYMKCELHPQHALIPRVMYVALEGDLLVGFTAGHLTRRFECDGELEWIDVVPERRGSGVGSGLLRLLAGWFGLRSASRICVDVDPANTAARHFYARHGAVELNEHWMVWNDIGAVFDERPRR